MSSKASNCTRCDWVNLNNPLYIQYHDQEWGVPVYNDNILFEFLVLESAQAGLSWETILNKRENYRRAFEGFDYAKIALYGEEQVNALLGDAGIVRHKLKIQATINNAKCFMQVQKEFGSFRQYIWGFVHGEPIANAWSSIADLPANTALSDTISKDLKKRGFKFMGSTTCYAYLQAIGVVNDHIVGCFRYQEVLG